MAKSFLGFESAWSQFGVVAEVLYPVISMRLAPHPTKPLLSKVAKNRSDWNQFRVSLAFD